MRIDKVARALMTKPAHPNRVVPFFDSQEVKLHGFLPIKAASIGATPYRRGWTETLTA